MILPKGKCAQKKRAGAGLLRFSAGALALAVATPALAAPTNPNAPPGTIIYSRDVPTRPAYIPSTEPGRPHWVQADQSELITTGLDRALAPISDSAAGAISSGAGAAQGTMGTGSVDISALLAGDPRPEAQSGMTGALGGGGGGGALGGSIGQATGAIRDAMSTIGSVLGGGH